MTPTTTRVRVVGTGWTSTYQDLGRRDTERLGVPTGGAADQHAATVANLVVGNPRGAVLLENVGGGLAVVPDRDVLAAVTGADAVVLVDGTRAPAWSPVVVPAGRELRVTSPGRGLRSYLALNGDLGCQRFLGSAAPDPRMGFTQALGAGDLLDLRTAFGPRVRDRLETTPVRLPVPRRDLPGGEWTIDVVAAPMLDTIPDLRDLVATSTYVVTPRSDHVGLRLDGPVLHPSGADELVSSGVPIGALEIPHADELIVLGRYRTLTAGYPVVGVATRTAQSLLAQAAPQQGLRFAWCSRAEAVARLRAAEHAVTRLESAARTVFAAAGLAPCPDRE